MQVTIEDIGKTVRRCYMCKGRGNLQVYDEDGTKRIATWEECTVCKGSGVIL